MAAMASAAEGSLGDTNGLDNFPHPSPCPLPSPQVGRRERGVHLLHSFNSRIAFPLAIFALSSAQSGIVGSQSVPGLLRTNG